MYSCQIAAWRPYGSYFLQLLIVVAATSPYWRVEAGQGGLRKFDSSKAAMYSLT
jgi:hypothetical protein